MDTRGIGGGARTQGTLPRGLETRWPRAGLQARETYPRACRTEKPTRGPAGPKFANDCSPGSLLRPRSPRTSQSASSVCVWRRTHPPSSVLGESRSNFGATSASSTVQVDKAAHLRVLARTVNRSHPILLYQPFAIAWPQIAAGDRVFVLDE